jgi:uncharacterized protein YjbI with pentapeptide repeats
VVVSGVARPDWQERLALHHRWLASMGEAGVQLYAEDADLAGVDLRGVDLTSVVLPGAVLAGAHLAGAVLNNAFLKVGDLRGADLSGATLVKAELDGVNGDGAVFDSADLTRCSFLDTSLRQARFDGAKMVRTSFSADLTGASLRNVSLDRADFSDSYLDDVDVAGAHGRAILEGAFVRGGDGELRKVGPDRIEARWRSAGAEVVMIPYVTPRSSL